MIEKKKDKIVMTILIEEQNRKKTMRVQIYILLKKIILNQRSNPKLRESQVQANLIHTVQV